MHDTMALADVALEGVDEPPEAFVLGTSRGREEISSGSGTATLSLEHADSLVEQEFGGLRFDIQEKVLRIRYHASNLHIIAAIEDGEMVSEDAA